MFETRSASSGHLYMAFVALLASSATMTVASLGNFSSTLVEGSVINTSSSSKPLCLPGEENSWNAVRAARIRELRGKYKELLSPSDLFAKQKNEEIYLEQ